MGRKRDGAVSPVSAEPPRYDPEVIGPQANRRCRDIIFLALFIVYWVGMFVVAALAIRTGNPQKLIAPTDSKGQYCGWNNALINSSLADLTNYPYLYYINPLSPLTTDSVCVAACPTVTAISTTTTAICDMNVTLPLTLSTLSTAVSAGLCSAFTYQSDIVLNRCMPSANVSADIWNAAASSFSISLGGTNITLQSLVSSERGDFVLAISDIVKTWPYILGGAGVSLVSSFLFLILMRWFVGLFVWITIIAANVVVDGFAVWLYFYWRARATAFYAIPVASQQNVDKWEMYAALGVFIAMCVLGVVLFLVTIFMRNRLRVGVEVIREASRAMNAMPLIVLFPFWTWGATAVLMVYFVYILLYIASPTAPVTLSVYTFSATNASTGMGWYHLVGCLWGWAVISGINQITLAGGIASWYWCRDKRALPVLPVTRSFFRAIFWHLGSVCLGGLLLTIVETIRFFLFKAQYTAKASQNKTAQWLLACTQCCMGCIEKIVKFINREAYIEIAVYGKAFFKSAGRAFGLLTRNCLRLVAVNFVADFVIIMGRLVITIGMGFLAYFLITWQESNLQLHFMFIPALLVAFEAFLISSIFLNIYHIAVDTIFLCFCEDTERHDGSPANPYYMSEQLQHITNLKNQKDGQAAGYMSRKTVGTRRIHVEEF
ncbi:hypothetical protein SmJEL517_g00954 [Synchytrium microbalum]|uniref:Protein PNS1 n=1 Tax=Synchytrium microbalum TaxID=1806994 RepID=A0A507CBF5_9FUNG|nr:uncharacterized protein SmJEL517_g00954 [Synchytrium microbalum]TPX36952.1 hypothetical protein SmJEL517_g00954 [Synchytrium microbalum]